MSEKLKNSRPFCSDFADEEVKIIDNHTYGGRSFGKDWASDSLWLMDEEKSQLLEQEMSVQLVHSY
jgi:hypothetical protein